jgi:titin
LPNTNGGESITNYKIEFSGDGGNTWNAITHAISASRSFNVSGLTRGKTYKFRVSAINSVGVGVASDSASATTLLALASAPESVSVSDIGSASAKIAWAAPSDSGGASITSYAVELSSDQGQTWKRVVWVNSDRLSATLSLQPGSTYQYKVTATTRAGTGAAAQGSFTALAILPSEPKSLTASAISDTSLKLSWSLPSSNGGAPITDYKIEMSGNGGVTWKTLEHSPSNNLAFKVTGLPAGTKRMFRVSTVNSVGSSRIAAQITATTLGSAPSSPSELKVSSRTATTVTITWSQSQVVAGSPVRGFIIEFSKDGGNTWSTATNAVTKNLSSVISGFKSGTSYKIRVKSFNDVGTSGASNVVTVTTR